MVEVAKNENGQNRGLHVVVINPFNGNVESAQAYDTYETSASLDNFLNTSAIPEGYIIVAACKDDCATNLSVNAKMWFANMGSHEIS